MIKTVKGRIGTLVPVEITLCFLDELSVDDLMMRNIEAYKVINWANECFYYKMEWGSRFIIPRGYFIEKGITLEQLIIYRCATKYYRRPVLERNALRDIDFLLKMVGSVGQLIRCYRDMSYTEKLEKKDILNLATSPYDLYIWNQFLNERGRWSDLIFSKEDCKIFQLRIRYRNLINKINKNKKNVWKIHL